MSSVPTLNQVRFRVRTDTGAVNSTPTWAAAEDTSVSLAVETSFCIRFTVNNTGSAAGAGPYIIRVSKNAGAYTAVTTSSGATLGAQSEATASSDADETAIPTGSFRLTAGTGTASAGVYDETGSATKSLTNAFYTELEYGLILKTAGAVPGDTFDFRLYNSTTAFATYSQTPRITVPQAGTDFTEVGFLGSVSNYSTAGVSSINCATTRAVPVGQLVVVAIATDNTTTTNSDAGVVTSVIDTKGNTYTKGKEWQNGSPGALAGTVNSLWYSQITVALAAADQISPQFSNATDRDAVVVTAYEFGVTAGKTVTVEGTNASVVGTSTPASLDVTTANIECLRVRTLSLQDRFAFGFTIRHTSGWTAWLPEPVADSGTVGTSHTISVEFKISVGTSAVSAPSAGAIAQMSSVYVAFRADTTGPPNHALLANDVGSGSSVTQPAITQVHNISANDIVSPSSVTHPVAVVRRDILANDVSSGSSVSVPTAASIVPPVACLANDVKSNSSVSQPSVQQLQALLANDVKSNSSVSQPAAVIRRDALANDVLSPSSVTKPTQLRQGHAFLANDVLSGSSVTHPAAIVGKTILANDVVSASSVGQPAVHAVQALAANDVLSASSVGVPAMLLPGQIEADDVVAASSVTTPTLHQAQVLDAVNVLSASSVTTPVAVIRRDILANDIVSASSVSQPAVHLNYGLLANDIVSGSSVSHPALAEIAPGVDALLANDVVSASSVSTPTLVVEGELIPIPPEVGGGGKVYGRGFPRKRWEELLRHLEQERQAALERAETFKGTKDRKQAKKAARAASEAIAAAREAADEAAVIAHAGTITRMLEGAAQATSLTEYLERMKAAKAEAEAMEDEDDVETVLMMVA